MPLLSQSMPLAFGKDGAELFSGAVASQLPELQAALHDFSQDRPGVRIAGSGSGSGSLRELLTIDGPVGAIAAHAIGRCSRPVRAVLFDKTPGTNWSLAWHQDRTICVAERRSVDGFGPWTIKAGRHHVTPPFALLTRMVTLRIHLDDVPASNAPLLVAPGSHLDGMITIDAIEEVVRRRGIAQCLAKAGDVWLYSTPIVHASEAATEPSHRRVLQIDFAAEELPGGLRWLGV